VRAFSSAEPMQFRWSGDEVFSVHFEESRDRVKQMIKALIFDLDNCLAAANEVGEDVFAPAFEAMKNANRGTLTAEQLAEAFQDVWRHPLDFVASKFGFSQEMLDAGWKVFSQTVVETPMKGYGDLAILRELPFELYLVTSGFRVLQESKIKALQIADLFRGVEIDAIDEDDRKGKQRIFASILETSQLRPEEVIVVGDNPDSEIEAGNRLGIRTVQILRPGVSRADSATYYVETFEELKTLLEKIKADGPTSFRH
jgi:FMN phosphatase YigB (HAD superfamily)